MRMRRIIWLALLMVLLRLSLVNSEERRYEFSGRVLGSDGKALRGRQVVVFLQSVPTPFSVRSRANLDGSYKFKNLRPGLYTLIVAVPLSGEMIRTIEIGPGFADSKGKIVANIVFDRKPDAADKTVSAITLSIPDRAVSEYRRAQDRLARDDFAGAIEHLKKAIELAPQFSVALNNLGTIAYRTKEYEQAAEYFRQALEHEPDSYAPLVNLGGALLSAGKVEESLEYNLRAVNARPEDALAHSQLGRCYFLSGRMDLAESELKKTKALDPAHFSFPRLVLAELYMRQRKPAAAISELEEFLNYHPDSERASAVRVLLERLRGRMEEGKSAKGEAAPRNAGCPAGENRKQGSYFLPSSLIVLQHRWSSLK